MNRWEREEKQVEKDYADRYISTHEYNRLLRDIQRDYRDAAAQAAAHEAAVRELERW